jgi:hypothetical protein
MTHSFLFSLYFSEGFGFSAPTNEAMWAQARQDAMDGKPILSSAGDYFPSSSFMKLLRLFTVCANVYYIAN